MRDAVVIGAGLVSPITALRFVHGGVKAILVTKRIGGLRLSQGTVDLLGYPDSGRVTQPLAEVETHITSCPGHPRLHFTPKFITEFTNWLKEVFGPELLVGDPRQNVIILTSLGALRPASLYQPSVAAGIPAAGRSHVTVGSKRLKNLYLKIITENLSRQATVDGVPIQVRSLIVDVEIRKDEADTTGTNHAHVLDNVAIRERLVATIVLHLRGGEVVSLPAVLGLNDLGAWKGIRKRLGHEVLETAIQSPSIPGTCPNQELTVLVKAQARFIVGSRVTSVETKDRAVTAVSISIAGHPIRIEVKNVTPADGGSELGALGADSYGVVTDLILGLPILGAEGQFPHGDFQGCEQPVLLVGLNVDGVMCSLDANEKSIHLNVYVAGGNLVGVTRWREKPGEGIVFASILCTADQTLGSPE